MRWRLDIIRLFFLMFFVSIVFRLFQLMVIDHGKYQVLAQQQHLEEVELLPDRGEIYTSDGYKVVMNSPTYLMFAVPFEMDQSQQTKQIDTLSNMITDSTKAETIVVNTQAETDVILDKNNPTVFWPTSFHTLKQTFTKDTNFNGDALKAYINEQLALKFSDTENQFVQILDRLTPGQKNEFEKLNIAGIYFKMQYKRQYPEGQLSANVIGFVGKNQEGLDQGYFGLEGYYDRYLSGKKGYEIIERDVEGKKIPFGLSKLNSPTQGRDLILSIKREFQYILEQHLEQALTTYKSKSATGIIMDPHSGAIWAMANAPSYYPGYWTDTLQGETDVSKVMEFKNLAISDSYEPGSVMKPVTISIGINENLITPESVYNDEGPVIYSGFPVRTSNNKYHGKITVTQILELSNNPGAAWVGTQIGKEELYSYYDKFNFGKLLNIDLQGEEQGIVRDKSDLRDIDIANMSFGQGISVTPLQMITAFASVINGGILYKPYVVEQMVDISGDKVIQVQPTILSKTISENTSTELRYMLQKVVAEGEFRWFVKQAGMDTYSIGGKTGTAQIPRDGVYDPNKTNTTFIGFAPVNDPQLIMLVRLSEPGTSTSSADTVVPLWMDIAKDIFPIIGIGPNQ